MHKIDYEKYYFINEYDTNLIKYQDKKTNIIFRNYKKKIDVVKITILRDFCRKKGYRFFLSNDVISILLGYTKTKPNDSISKLMLKPNFGINADKKEWANFCKKTETYDRKWWVSLQKEFGKYS